MAKALVFGAGRMGRSLVGIAGELPGLEIVAQVSRTPPQPGQGGPPFFDSLEAAQEHLGAVPDLVIDFTLPQGTLAAANWCGRNGVALLSGVTGIGAEVEAALNAAAESAPVLWAPNLGIGINLMAAALRNLAGALDPGSEITIEEVHHAGKKDAPSGTALFLARQLCPGASDDFPGIEFVSRREGEVVGDHSVSIRMPGESFTLSHHAEDRSLFARGALAAGKWLVGKPAGRYSAADWIRDMAPAKLK